MHAWSAYMRLLCPIHALRTVKDDGTDEEAAQGRVAPFLIKEAPGGRVGHSSTAHVEGEPDCKRCIDEENGEDDEKDGPVTFVGGGIESNGA